MKIIVLILFLFLVLISIVAVLLMLVSAFIRVRRRKTSKTVRSAQRLIIPFWMVAEYYGDLRKASDEKIKNLFEEGLSFKQKGKFSEAIKIFKKCLGENVSFEQNIGLLLIIGNCYFAMNKLSRAQECYEKADSFSRESGNENGRLSCLLNLGLVCATNERWDEAIKNYHEAINLDRKLGYAKGEAIDLNTLALLYEHKGDFEGALSHYTNSLGIFEKLNYREKTGLVEDNIERVKNLSVKYQKPNLEVETST